MNYLHISLPLEGHEIKASTRKERADKVDDENI
jgi:hypothetical protein